MRAEDEWVDEAPKPTVGQATSSITSSADTAGRLYVPDPEARRGWREYWVDKPKPASRPLGFRR